jgi:hypothetical protein
VAGACAAASQPGVCLEDLQQVAAAQAATCTPSQPPATPHKHVPTPQVLERTQNGLEVAEADLAHRGPGDLLAGVKQSGASALSSTTLHEMTRRPQVRICCVFVGGGESAARARREPCSALRLPPEPESEPEFVRLGASWGEPPWRRAACPMHTAWAAGRALASLELRTWQPPCGRAAACTAATCGCGACGSPPPHTHLHTDPPAPSPPPAPGR